MSNETPDRHVMLEYLVWVYETRNGWQLIWSTFILYFEFLEYNLFGCVFMSFTWLVLYYLIKQWWFFNKNVKIGGGIAFHTDWTYSVEPIVMKFYSIPLWILRQHLHTFHPGNWIVWEVICSWNLLYLINEVLVPEVFIIR